MQAFFYLVAIATLAIPQLHSGQVFSRGSTVDTSIKSYLQLGLIKEQEGNFSQAIDDYNYARTIYRRYDHNATGPTLNSYLEYLAYLCCKQWLFLNSKNQLENLDTWRTRALEFLDLTAFDTAIHIRNHIHHHNTLELAEALFAQSKENFERILAQELGPATVARVRGGDYSPASTPL